MGLILPRWGLILPRIPSPTPVYSALTNTFWGYVHNTPYLTPKHPFPGLKLKVGKWTTVCVKLIPMWQNIWKVGKTFLEVGKKKYSWCHTPTWTKIHKILSNFCRASWDKNTGDGCPWTWILSPSSLSHSKSNPRTKSGWAWSLTSNTCCSWERAVQPCWRQVLGWPKCY